MRPLRGPKYTGMDRSLVEDQADVTTVLSVGDLCILLAEDLEKEGVRITFGEKVVGLGGTEDDAEEAWVETENAETSKTTKHVADFAVGCDGGNSTMRRLMHGKGNFPGFTWDEQIVATNVWKIQHCCHSLWAQTVTD